MPDHGDHHAAISAFTLAGIRSGRLAIQADVVEGETGRIISEWPLRITEAHDENLAGIGDFLRSQVAALAGLANGRS
jgi:hypothetical protein